MNDIEYKYIKMKPRQPNRPERPQDIERTTIGQLLRKGVVNRGEAIQLAQGQDIEIQDYKLIPMTAQQAKHEHQKQKERAI